MTLVHHLTLNLILNLNLPLTLILNPTLTHDLTLILARHCRSSRRLVDRFAQCMDLSTDRSRLDCYFRGSRPAKPAGARSAPPDLQLTPDDDADDADGSEVDDIGDGADTRPTESAAGDCAEEADGTPPTSNTAQRQQSCCGSKDEGDSDTDGKDAVLAAADGDSKPGDAASWGATEAESREQHEQPVACAEPPRSLSSSGRRRAASSPSPAHTAGVQAADPAASAAADAHAARSQQPPAEAEREADGDALFADIDLREQAALMALFEDRRRSSHTKRLLAAATKSVAPSSVAAALVQDKAGCGTWQDHRHRLGRSISAPAAAPTEVDSDSAAKRQRTLRNYFQARNPGELGSCGMLFGSTWRVSQEIALHVRHHNFRLQPVPVTALRCCAQL